MLTRSPRNRTPILAGAIATGMALVLAVTLFTPTAQRADAEQRAGCQAAGGYTVCTTDPRDAPDGKDLTIVEELQRRIAATSGDGAIRVAMYEWTLKRVANDLVDAQNRGVDVRVVMGTNDDNPTGNDAIIAILKAGGIPVTVCADGCLPNRDGKRAGAMHNKFFLIDDEGTETVMQTSANLTVGQVQRHQNLLVSDGDSALYGNYLDYWNRLKANSWTVDGDTWNEGDRSRDGDKDLSKSYVFPRDSGDPLLAALGNVTECRADDDSIWVSHSITERTKVRERLNELENAGCDVKVVVANTDDEKFMEGESGKGKLTAGKVRALKGNHNKFVVIDAKYAGQWREVVFTGSHNLSYNALENANDIMLRLINPDVAALYVSYFRKLYL